MSHVTYTPCTLAPRLPDMCEENGFHFFCTSARGKQHFSYTTGSQAKLNHAAA